MTSTFHPLWIVPIAFGTALLPAPAQTYFNASGYAIAEVYPGDDPSYNTIQSSFALIPAPVSTSDSTSFTGDGISAVGTAAVSYSASAGFLGAWASATASSSYPATLPNLPDANVDFHYSSGYASSSAGALLHNLIFTGPTESVPVSLNYIFSSVGQATIQNPEAYPYANARTETLLSIGLRQTDSGTSVGGDSGRINFFANSNGSDELYSYGLLSGYTDGTAELTTATWEVPTGVPLSLYFGVDAIAITGTGYGSTGSSEVLNFAALPIGVPLFNLPEGFTVNAPEAYIIDNIYAPVPEPEYYAALAGLGLIGFALWRKGRLSPVE